MMHKRLQTVVETPEFIRRAKDIGMTEAFDSIKKGLKEALAHVHGEDVGAVVHEVHVPEPDVAAIRAKSGLSQREFARSIGVAVGTLQGWEQGRRRPEGPARVLLALIEKRPAIVQEELRPCFNG